MRREDLINRLQRSPFRPFRICVADGAEFDVRHPEFLHVARSLAMLFDPAMDLGAGAFEDYHWVVLQHITRLEPLGPSPSAG